MSSDMTLCPDWSTMDQYDSQSEGLAAKLEDVNQPSARSGLKRKAEDSSPAESEDEEDGAENHNDNGRRVRARSLIDDEQLAVLKGYYAINPRPKKEEIIMIANYINFPTRVVQVRIFISAGKHFARESVVRGRMKMEKKLFDIFIVEWHL